MIKEGKIILFNFPQTDINAGKLRPALIIRSLPGSFDDWLICMITTQLNHKIVGFDEIIHSNDPGFIHSGLKGTSLIRVIWMAFVSQKNFSGVIGNIHRGSLDRIRSNICHWISDSNSSYNSPQ